MKVKTKSRIFTLLLTILIIAQPGVLQVYAKEAKAEPYLDISGPRVIIKNDNAKEKTAKYVDGEILVRFKDSSSKDSAKIASINRELGATTIKTFKSIEGLQLLSLPKNISVDDAIKKYESNSAVEYAQPNFLYYVDETTPDDPDFNKLWGLDNEGQEVDGQTGTVDADIDAVEAWDTTTGSSDIIIAVIDTGVMYTHPELQNNIWTNTSEIPDDGIDNDGNGYVDDVRGWDFFSDDNDPMDEMGHGTHVSGTIAAEANNAQGVAGVMWNAKIMPLRFIGPEGGSTEDAIEAMEYADANGAQIMNNSWGSDEYDLALEEAFDASPILAICAAGNDGVNNDSYMHYPSSYDCDNIVSVAATDNQDNLATFSNYGVSTVDVAAPGVDIYSTLPAGDYRHGSLLFSDSMDTLNNWTTYPFYDSWAVNTNRYVSEPASIADADYFSNETNWLYTELDLSGAVFAKLQYDLWLDTEEDYDFLYVLASYDDYTYYILDQLTGQTEDFQTFETDLTDFAGSSTVYIAFVLQSDSSLTAEGAYIDDVKVYTTNDAVPSYGYYSGTSMATPHVAGLAGLIKAANPMLTNQQIKDIIIDNVDQKTSLNGKVLSGGRINANNSVLAAASIVGVPVSGVSLDQETMSLVAGGATGTLAATVMPEDATNKNVTWTSSDEAVATVVDGVVTPLAAGTATITVETEDGGFTATCEVTVTPASISVTGVSLDQETMSLLAGGATGALAATVMPEDATNKNVTWTSSDETIATVVGGIVTPVTPGVTTVTVETEDGHFTDNCEVTVGTANISVTGVSLDQSSMSLVEGGAAGTLAATVMPEDATNKNVTWASSNEAVATVVGGVVTPISAGIATITVETEDGGFSATCEVTVTPATVAVTGVSLDKSTMSLAEGGAAGTLAATVMPEDATNKNVTWASSNEAVATVVGGVVTPVSAGIATITVETEDGGFTATCEVTVTPAAIPVTGVGLNKSTMDLEEGGATGKLVATVRPGNATNKNITWSSSNNYVASVVDGVVTPIHAGQAIITVETEDGGFTANCIVTVQIPRVPVSGVGLNRSSMDLVEGGSTGKLIATVRPENATNKNITWSSTNNYVVSVVDGVVTPLHQGTAIIKVETEDGNYTAYCTVNVAPATVAVSGVSLDQEAMSLMEGGATGTLTATVMPENATNKNVIWYSSDSSVATVEGGVVTPIAAGSAKITVETADGGLTDACIVTVGTAEVAVTGVSLDQETMDLDAGQEAGTLIATVMPENATNKNVIWSSSDEAVATVEGGVVTPLAEGTTTIKVETVDGNFAASCTVTVAPAPILVTGVSLNKSTMSLTAKGSTGTLTATITPENATNKNVTWTSSDESVATVVGGVVTPLAKGTTVITVETEDGNYTASCDITVTNKSTHSTTTSSHSSIQATPVPYTIIDENGDTIAAIDIDGSGSSTFAITSTITNILMKYAVDENAVGLLCNLKFGENEPKSTDVQFSVLLFANAEQNNINKVIFKMGKTSMTFDKDSLGELSANASTLKFNIKTLNDNELSEELLKQVGSHPVFAFSFFADSKEITHFDSPVKVSLDYTLHEGETAENLVAYIINDNDELVLAHNCIYNEETGKISFYTDSASRFVVMKSGTVKQFIDLTNFMWAQKAINILTSRNIVNGMDETHFAPELNVTKGQFIKLLMDTLSLNDENATSDFSDVSKDHWAYAQISSAVKLGIASGTGEDSFGVNNELTRKDMAVLSYKAIMAADIKLRLDEARAKLIDLDSLSADAQEAIEILYKAGVISGVGHDMFDPDGKLNRAAATQIIYKIYMLQ